MHDRVTYELNTTLRNRTDRAIDNHMCSGYERSRIYSALYSSQLSVYNNLYWRLNEELEEEDA